MIESHYPTTEQLIRGQRTRRNLVFGALIVTTALIFGIVGSLMHFTFVSGPVAWSAGLSALVCLVVPVVVWKEPRRGLYLLCGGAILLGEAANVRPTLPNSYVPFWLNISTAGQSHGTGVLNALVFSPAEAVMVITTLAWLVRSIANRELRFAPGPFFGWILAYSVMVAYGWFNGLTSGADRTMALYEIRAQAHFVLAYVLAAHLLTKREHIRTLLWTIIVCSGLLAIFGAITYFTVPVVTEQGFLIHDDMLFFNLLFFVFLVFWLAYPDRLLGIWAFLLSPIAAFTLFANGRRAAIGAFIMAFVPLLPMLYVLFFERRKQVTTFILIFSIFSAIYLPLAWNSSGSWALGARAIRSQSDPSARDASSDYYRLAEDMNLKFTRDLQPWRGFGYGKVFAQIVVLPQVTTTFLQFMPHNSVLWVWMRLGHIGFFLFMMMIASVCIIGPQVLKRTRDPFLRAAGLLGILQVLMLFMFGKYDMQFVNPRQMFLTAVLIGMIAAIDKIERESSAEAPASGR